MTEDERRIIPPARRSKEYMAGWDFAHGLAEDGRDITHLEPPADWAAQTKMGFRMRVLQAQKPTDTPTLPPPAGCSTEYRDGWEAAEDWIRCGEPVSSLDLHPEVMPGGMTPEQTAGFRARILKELEPESGQVLSFRRRTRPA
jgi:hypothetical protein